MTTHGFGDMVFRGRKITTSHGMKPIPDRRYDWSATFDDYDGAPVDENTASRAKAGFGATEADAIIDLINQVD